MASPIYRQSIGMDLHDPMAGDACGLIKVIQWLDLMIRRFFELQLEYDLRSELGLRFLKLLRTNRRIGGSSGQSAENPEEQQA